MAVFPNIIGLRVIFAILHIAVGTSDTLAGTTTGIVANRFRDGPYYHEDRKNGQTSNYELFKGFRGLLIILFHILF